ncbi:MAG: hypothetical protein II955_07080 [Clostridia bacterium]|nr:hypothetical protein [Clostridia bacterium]
MRTFPKITITQKGADLLRGGHVWVYADEVTAIDGTPNNRESDREAHGGITDGDLEFLAGRKLDVISMDCDDGSWQTPWMGHMGCRDDLAAREDQLRVGAADSHTVFIANHFSHNGLVPYEELQRLLPGFLVSYDGMKVRI